MTDQEIRYATLEVAYEVWKEKGSIGRAVFSLFEKSKDWGVEEKDLNRNLDYLDQKGWMKVEGYESGRPLVRITVEGVDEYERTHGRGNYGKKGCLADWNR